MDKKYFKLNHRFALGAAVSLFFVFTLMYYGPMKLYIENSETLWFDLDSVINLTSFVTAVGMVVITLLISLPKKTVHSVLCGLFFAVALGLCIQGNLFNIDYGSGVLDGSQIAWKDYTTYGAIDSAMWTACLSMPFALMMVFKEHWRKVLIFTSISLVIVQATVLSVIVYQNYSSLNKITYEVTTAGIYDLSQKENTLVFVLDSFDSKYIEKVKKDYPDYEERLSGFTEYENNLSSGSGAILGLPSLLTGDIYKRETSYSSYIDEIWNDDTVYSLLNKSGVDTRIYAQTEYFSDEAKDSVKNIVDHIDGVGPYSTLAKTLYKYTAYTYAPHYLKSYFWLDLNTISKYKSDNAYRLDDAKFYSNYVRSQGFSYTEDYDSALRIYHLNGVRSPYTLTKNSIKRLSGTSLNEQIYGCFNFLFTMIDDLKENNMYENTTIIITSNNGTGGKAQHSLLLVKKAGESDGYTISNAPTSSFDLAPTLASLVTEDYTAYGSGRTYFDTNTDDSRTRYFYLNAGSNDSIRIEQYSTRETADNTESMRLLDYFFSENNSKEKYRLGTLLTFAMDATANVYCREGFNHTTGWRTPMAGPNAKMIIPIDSIPSNAQDIHVFFGIDSIESASNCTIKANGKQVFSAKIGNSFKTNGLNFTVPTSLIGEDNTIELDFCFTDIDDDEMSQPISKRTKTIVLSSFKMYTQ